MVKRLRGPMKRNEPIELLSGNRFYAPFILPQNDLKTPAITPDLFLFLAPSNPKHHLRHPKRIHQEAKGPANDGHQYAFNPFVLQKEQHGQSTQGHQG